ncbi:hypothetical protein [Paenibacillus sp. DP01]|uniref:hypothetical protein n=1 Tax=Paenibacillus sp. DP01 TaxID=3373096 RepID=UPI00384C87E8
MQLFYEEEAKNIPDPIIYTMSGHTLKGLDRICNDLAEIIVYFDGGYYGELPNNSDEVEWSDVIQWLQLAMAVNDVSVSFTKFDYSAVCCENIWELEQGRGTMTSGITTNLLRFNFIWGALESIITIIDTPSKYPFKESKGKYNSACYYLKTLYEPRVVPLFYKEFLNGLFERLEGRNQFNKVIKEFCYKDYVGFSGMGLNVIKRIRNKIAHGNMRFPEPDDQGYIYEEIIEISSYLLAINIQMLLVSYLQIRNYIIGFNEDGTIDDTYEESVSEVSLEIYLRSIHLEIEEEDLNQLKLF